MNGEMRSKDGRITGTSEATKTAPDGAQTPSPEPHHLASPENAGSKMTDRNCTPRSTVKVLI